MVSIIIKSSFGYTSPILGEIGGASRIPHGPKFGDSFLTFIVRGVAGASRYGSSDPYLIRHLLTSSGYASNACSCIA
jgi:hypothetical protein